MGRLDEKWAQANTVVGDVERHIEGQLDALIALKAKVTAKSNAVFAKQMAPLEESSKALEALDSKLNLLSNQGPDGPLPGSGDLQDGFQSNPALTQPGSIQTQPTATPSAPEVALPAVPFRTN